jgi:hypothetical protein
MIAPFVSAPNSPTCFSNANLRHANRREVTGEAIMDKMYFVFGTKRRVFAGALLREHVMCEVFRAHSKGKSSS